MKSKLLSYFFENETSALLVLVFVVAAILVFTLVTFIVSNYYQSTFKDRIKDRSNTVRIYVVDIKNDKVEYFNASKLRRRNSTSITSFYSHFESKEREKLISWIGDLLDNDPEAKNYMEINAYVKRFKKNVSSILQVQKIDYAKKIIYFESYLLAPGNGKVTIRNPFSKDRLVKAIHAREGQGYTFCINFFNRITKTDEISNLAYIELKNIIFKFLSDKVLACESENSQIIIANFECDDRIKALDFINNVVEKLKSYLLIDSFSEEIDVSVGATENEFFFRDVKSLIKTISTLAEYAKDEGQSIVFFDESKSKLKKEKSFKSEVENIIANDKLEFLYQPIYSFKYSRVIAYITSINTIDSVFNNIDDLKAFAIRTDDDHELFTTIVKNSVSHFVTEKGPLNVRLFLPITVNEIQYVSGTAKYINAIHDTNIVLAIKEIEIGAFINEDFAVTNFINNIRAIKSLGFSVALEIDDNVLQLSPNIYKLFDFYIIGINNFVGNKNKISIPMFKGLVENLIRFDKPIIAKDIQNWDVLDLIYKFGIENICGDPIAPKHVNIVPLDKKTIQKIKKLKA